MRSMFLLLLGMLGAQVSYAQALTVEETMGAIFLYGSRYASLANTNAKPMLYRVLDQPNATRHARSGAVAALGYTGDDLDAVKLERKLRENFIGTLRPEDSVVVEAIPTALAVMTRRGVSTASSILVQMTSASYWIRTQIAGFDGVSFPHGLTNEMPMRALVAYAQSGSAGWREKVQAFKAGLTGQAAKDTAEWRLDFSRLELAAKEFQSARSGTVDTKTRELLRQAFNGDVVNPGPGDLEKFIQTNRKSSRSPKPEPPSTALLGQQLQTLSGEAIIVFTNALARLLADDFAALATLLADNGNPLLSAGNQTPEAVTAKANKLKAMARDMEQTKAIVREVQTKGLIYGNAQGETLSDGTVIIQIPCLDSQETKKRYLPHHVIERTTDSENRLVIYMIKKGGQWYWNPFGW